MSETTAETVIRLRLQASAAEQRGRQMMNVSVLLVGRVAYDRAVADAKSLLAEAAALRQHADRLQLDDHV